MELTEANDKGPSIRAVPAATRAVRILRRLAEADEPMGMSQLAVELDLVPSTCMHILRVLSAEGLVTTDPASKRYKIGIGVLSLARGFLNQSNLLMTVQPRLDRIARQRRVTAVYVERSDPSTLVVSAVAEGSDMFSVKVTVGTSFAMYSSASGRCFAAADARDKAHLRALFESLRWQNPPDFETWHSDVRAVPERGFAIDAGHYIRGVTVIAAPVVRSGPLHSCVAAVCLKEQSSQERLALLAAELGNAAREIASLGG